MRHILPEKLVALYLYGPLTTGDFYRDSSDIDLLAATSSDIGDTEFEALREMHRDFVQDNRDWDDRIDVAYLSVAALKMFDVQSSKMAVISLGEPFHVLKAGKNWLVNWYLVREGSVALFGPPPKAIINPTTQQEFVQWVQEHGASWGGGIEISQKRKGQAYAILTMCRALYTIKSGEQVSKRQAALWAQEELPEWSRLIKSVLAWRQSRREEQVGHAATYPETLRFVNFVRELIVA